MRRFAFLLLFAACADPQAAEEAATRGLTLARAGDVSAARKSFEEALAHDRDNAKARYNLAVLLLEQNELPAAVEHLAVFLKTRPVDALGHFQLARARMALGAPDEALEALRLSVAGGLADYALLAAAPEFKPLYGETRFLAVEKTVAERAGVAPGAELLRTKKPAPYGGTPVNKRAPGVRGPGECAGRDADKAECG